MPTHKINLVNEKLNRNFRMQNGMSERDELMNIFKRPVLDVS